jgi:hypothetical protein
LNAEIQTSSLYPVPPPLVDGLLLVALPVDFPPTKSVGSRPVSANTCTAFAVTAVPRVTVNVVEVVVLVPSVQDARYSPRVPPFPCEKSRAKLPVQAPALFNVIELMVFPSSAAIATTIRVVLAAVTAEAKDPVVIVAVPAVLL